MATLPTNQPQAGNLNQDLGPSQVAQLGPYVVRPHGVHFATQAPNETVLLILRRHPITQLLWIMFAAVLVILPLFFTPYLSGIFADLRIPPSYLLVLNLFWYLVTFAFTLTNFVLWYFNVNIITNLRVLDIDFPSLLIQEVNGTLIPQIEDTTYRRIGVLATLFDYGNVYVQTAGSTPNIEFLQTPHPRQTVKIILDLMQESQNE